MNEMIIIGIIAVVFIGLFAVTWGIENLDRIVDWLCDVVTFYYKFKLHRRRKKNV